MTFEVDAVTKNIRKNNNNINEKIGKYGELEIRIKMQWRMKKVKTVLIILSTTGVIPKHLLENMKLSLSETLYKPMQKQYFLPHSEMFENSWRYSNILYHPRD